MAKNQYTFEKRRREIEKKRKKEEKLQRKLDKLVCVSNPVVKTITLVSKPYYGFRGALHFLEDVLNGVTY